MTDTRTFPPCQFCGAEGTQRRRSPVDGAITGSSCDAHFADLLRECTTPEWVEREVSRIQTLIEARLVALALVAAPTKGVH